MTLALLVVLAVALIASVFALAARCDSARRSKNCYG